MSNDSKTEPERLSPAEYYRLSKLTRHSMTARELWLWQQEFRRRNAEEAERMRLWILSKQDKRSL